MKHPTQSSTDLVKEEIVTHFISQSKKDTQINTIVQQFELSVKCDTTTVTDGLFIEVILVDKLSGLPKLGVRKTIKIPEESVLVVTTFMSLINQPEPEV